MLISFLIFHKPPFFSTSSHTIWWNHYSFILAFTILDFFTVCFSFHFNSMQDGLFRGILRMGRAKYPPPSKICHTYPTMMKLGTVIPYLKKIQKIYEWCYTPPEFCWHQHFFHQKSANFVISRNTDIDCILISNF